jgi:hypothetical protein
MYYYNTNLIWYLLNPSKTVISVGTCSTTVVISETKVVLVIDMPTIVFAYVAPTTRSIGTTNRESIPTSQQHTKATTTETRNVEKLETK